MIKDYDDLDSLFFQVLAKKHEERNEEAQTLFNRVPYLNSSLFEPTDIEHDTIFVSNLRDDKPIPIISSTVLKDQKGKKRSGELSTLEYLFDFLDAYDFSSEGSEDIQEDNKTLINASVLGLIFEKINGYKDGSFFTPGFITMYMCRETIRKAVVQKFNEEKGWNCKDLDAVYEMLEVKDRNEANTIINSLKICDPAVGSGHFLVSALNELIAIKNDLKILQDVEGKRLKEYEVEVVNDELVITDDEGELFEYHPGNKESQRVQMALFHEKQTLIENCLFGVDINPNSVKICRLRLWIELLKNAYYKGVNELETLPNIDINIKSGNSLISRFDLDDDLKAAFKDKKIAYGFLDYKKAVADYKNTASKAKKREILQIINEVKSNFRSTLDNKFVAKFQKAQGLVINEQERQNNLKAFGEKITKADKNNLKKLQQKAEKALLEKEEIVNNVIYENAFEWRFEFPEVLNDNGDYVGFDVVIGNPPYGVSIKGKERSYLVSSLSKVPDYEIYYWFINQGHKILRNKGYSSYIIPNTILFNVFAQRYRMDLFNNWLIEEVLDCTDIDIFEDATVRNIIFLFQKHENGCEHLYYRNTAKISEFNNLILKERSIIPKETVGFNNQNWGLIFKLDNEVLQLVSKIKSFGIELSHFFPETSQGLIAYDKYKGQSKEIIKNRAYHHFSNPNGLFKKWLYGEDVTRYVINWNGKEFIDYSDGIANPREPKFFSGKRILIREITNPRIYATITNEELYNDPAILIIKEGKDSFSLEFLLAILNSKLATFYHFNSSPKATKGAFPKILVYDVNNFPLPSVFNGIIKEKLEALVSKMLELKKGDPETDVSNIDNQIDHLVYQLYGLTEEEIAIVESS